MDKMVKNFIRGLEPADLIAILVILGVVFLNWKGVQTMLNSAVLIIIGFYFSTKGRKKY